MVAATTKRFLKDYPEALIGGFGAVFVGAGVSMGAGYPSWASLLTEVGDELGVQSGELQDLAALAQWSIQENGSATQVRSTHTPKTAGFSSARNPLMKYAVTAVQPAG
ncbi:hypothetical protein [Brucella anthropi]|uniref:hypothetical protein n=1 Tax=Brucella anthropi TaxID=529 RepID=UPI001AEF70FB|nr:hypothetical protein [Brucella anthropi]